MSCRDGAGFHVLSNFSLTSLNFSDNAMFEVVAKPTYQGVRVWGTCTPLWLCHCGCGCQCECGACMQFNDFMKPGRLRLYKIIDDIRLI